MAVLPIDLTGSPIAELTSQRINFTVVDEDGVGIPAANLATLTLTLFVERDGAIINSRDGIDILNTNGGTVGVDGVGTYTMEPADNPIVRTGSKQEEYHIALFEWTYSGGTKDGKQPVRLKVVNLQNVS